MAPARSRRRGTSPRRKRIWARQGINSTAIDTATPFQQDMLSALKVSLGGSWPLGTTVGPVIFSGLQVRTTTLTEVTPRVIIGVRVGSVDIEAVDQDPADLTMLDWMLWSAFPASGVDDTNLVIGDGPDGSFRTSSMRKLEEVNDTLWGVFSTPDTGVFNIRGYASTLVILP